MLIFFGKISNYLFYAYSVAVKKRLFGVMRQSIITMLEPDND